MATLTQLVTLLSLEVILMDMFYYDKDLKAYPTQLDAIASGKDCYFYYYDRELNSIDWKVEPRESLAELYKQRAQQIRDSYDHVIVCYSGGYDSTNILEAFYYNGIHIDEILIVGALSQDPEQGSDANHNGDLYHNAFPTLNQMSLPNTKITIADYTDYFRDPTSFTLIKRYGDEWTKHIGGFKSVHNLFWYDLKKFIGANNDKKTCYIMGSDKVGFEYLPRPGHTPDGCWQPCVRFNDLSVNDYGANYQDENFTRINFYNGIDDIVTRIMRKQAHMMLRFCEEVERLPDGARGSPYLERIAVMNKLFYDLRNPLIFEAKKSIYSSLSHRDMFMLDKRDSNMYNMFVEGLKTIKKVGPVSRKYCFWTRPHWLT
jgi:hypothetical protein